MNMGLLTAVQSGEIELLLAPQDQRWPDITYRWAHEALVYSDLLLYLIRGDPFQLTSFCS